VELLSRRPADQPALDSSQVARLPSAFDRGTVSLPPPRQHLPGLVAAADTREETEALMREAMNEHVAILRQTGQPLP
jgi:hypothetical protein